MASVETVREIVEDDLRAAIGGWSCSKPIVAIPEPGQQSEIEWRWSSGTATVRLQKEDGTVVLVHLRACVQIQNVEVLGEDEQH